LGCGDRGRRLLRRRTSDVLFAIVINVNRTAGRLLWVVAGVVCAIIHAAGSQEWLAVVPSEQRDAFARRLDAYVKANRARDWDKLYDLVSVAGRGGVDHRTFIARMKAAHGTEFANSPDLLEFRPERTSSGDKAGYDVYGCAKAQREGREFNGIALSHAVFEHNGWFFSGWRFTEFPNEPCKALSDPGWEAPEAMNWNQPMEELRGPVGVQFHIDKPNK
jgi:hypothetical protein